MDRNAPCPCGSGRKFKKCHGAAVPPEAAALPPDARAEWMRGVAVLGRQRRVAQELLDWAERKLGAEWVDAALDAWGVNVDEDVDEGVADLFTSWSLFNYAPSALAKPIAAAWLGDAAGRKSDEEARRLVTASLSAPLGLWEVETVEAGIGATITDRLSDFTCFVHEPDLTHDIGPSEFVLAHVIEVDGVYVFSGLHADPLLGMDGRAMLASALTDAGVSAPPLPPTVQVDPVWQIRLASEWTKVAAVAYGDQHEDDDDQERERE